MSDAGAKRPGLGIACALASATGLGLNPPIAAYLNAKGLVPAESVVLRAVLMLAVAAVMVAMVGRSVRVPRNAWWPLAGITAGSAGLSLCYLSSVAFIPVALAVIIFYTFPLVVLVLSPRFEGARLSLSGMALAGVAFCGLAIAIGPTFASLDVRGVALAGLAAASAVMIFFCGRHLAGRVNEAVNAFWVHLLGLPVMVAVAWAAGRGAGWFGGDAGAVLDGIALPALLLGITYTAGYLFMMHGLRLAPASRLTPYYNIEPVVSIVAAAVLIGERLDASQYLGGCLVIAALVVSGFSARRQPAAGAKEAA